MNHRLIATALILAVLFFANSVAGAQTLSRQQRIELVKKSFSHQVVAPRLDAPLAVLCEEITRLHQMDDAYWVGEGHNGTDRKDASLWSVAGINGLETIDIMARHKPAVKARLASIFKKDLDERAKLDACAYTTKWGTTEQLEFESSSKVFWAYQEIHFLASGDTRDTSDITMMRWKRDQDIQKRWTTLGLQKAMAPYADRAKFNKRINAVREEARLHMVSLF